MSKGFKNLLKSVVIETKRIICVLAETELSNSAKKEKLDKAVIKYIQNVMFLYAPSNIIAKFCFNFVINKFILPYIDDFTQLIYNLLKSKIDSNMEI